LRFFNLMAVSDSPLVFDRERWRGVLASYRIDGRPVFDLTREEDRKHLDELVHIGETNDPRKMGRTREYEPCPSVLHWTKTYELVTDDNMTTEWYRPWRAVPK
jgi:hypothetical protein